jgi:glycerol-3-phosphate acyltransferase PlsY
VIAVPDSETVFVSDAISATALRLHLGPGYGCLTGILDILKAAVPALAFKLWQPEAPYYLFAASMAAVGHDWPTYYRYKGGQGMSPTMGGMLVVDWLGVVAANALELASDLVVKNIPSRPESGSCSSSPVYGSAAAMGPSWLMP